MPLIPALGRQRQAELCEFKASLVYRASSRTGSKATQRNPISKNPKEKSQIYRHLHTNSFSSLKNINCQVDCISL